MKLEALTEAPIFAPAMAAAADPSREGHTEAAIDRFLRGATAVAIGRFALDGEIRSANRGLRWILGDPSALDGSAAATLASSSASSRQFVAPTFPELVRRLRDNGGAYDGLLAFGDQGTTYRSLRGTVRLIAEEVLLLAEFDAPELEQINNEVAALNSEVINLQRSLVSEKHALSRALADLRNAQVMLVHSEKMNALGLLVAGVAHEINNPIAFVGSNVHSLGKSVRYVLEEYNRLEEEALSEAPEGRRERVAAMRKQADIDFIAGDLENLLKATMHGIGRVKHIVEDLRSFSRLDEAGEQSVDLSTSLASTIALAGPTLRKNHVTVIYDRKALPALRCKPAELNQVFLNILVNAAQAVEARGPGKGRIEVRARDEGDALVFEFEDNGGGIPEAIRSRIFDPFFTTKPVGQGTGIGLSLAYRIVVEGHGGTIDVDSTPGEGATFRIRIPKGHA